MTVLTPQEFAKKGAGVALSERSSYQQHFLDLCAMLGAPAPAEADPAGSSTPSRRGWRRPGAARASPTCGTREPLRLRVQGRHKDLKAAYDQLLQYREALGTRRSSSSPIRTVTRYTPTSPAPS